MNATAALALIARGEGRNVEFKQGVSTDAKVARTLAAFANTRGGVVFFGVGDRGELLGAPRPDELAARVRAAARERIEPPLEVLPRRLRLDGVAVVLVAVERSDRRPHVVIDDQGERETVVRVGASNRRAQGATLRALTHPPSERGLDPLERKAIAWIEANERDGAESRATARGFARALNVGAQRALRAFIALERKGLLVAYENGRERRYARP